MLASPLYPAPTFSPIQNTEEHSSYRPVKDADAFNSLLPPAIEFVEGSSSGTLAVGEGKYEPINATPKAPPKTQSNGVPPSTPNKASNASAVSESNGKVVPLFTGTLDNSWPHGCTIGSGLYNIGNTCFLNSALQCLLHTAPLLKVVLIHSKAECRVKTGFCMSCAFRQVMLEAHSKEKQPFNPSPISARLQTIAKHMRKGRQEDSHEFLRYAIDALQKSCLGGYSPKIDPKLAETTWVHKIFGGRLRSRVTCRECNHNSDTYDSILDLSIDIQDCTGLKEALRRFVAVDYLKGANKYKCEKCKKPVIAEKQFTIHGAPLALTVHLKRFTPLGRKVSHVIKYDERLSLQPYMSEGEFGPVYSLYGVVSHAGGGPHSGHYYAHVKGANGRWYEMNDESVTPVNGAPTNMKNAYILFYIREKGQALEAAVRSTSSRPLAPKPGVAASMKKRKMTVHSDDEEDTGVKAPLPAAPASFIGPVLPSPPVASTSQVAEETPRPDPQAQLIKKKIQALDSPALRSLSQYADDDDDNDNGGGKDGEKFEGPEAPGTCIKPDSKSSAIGDTKSDSSPPLPHISSPVVPSPATISASSFYGSSNTKRKTPESNDKKRKSPDSERDDDHDNTHSMKDWVREPLTFSSPNRSSSGPSKFQKSHGSGKKPPFGGVMNPFNRVTGGNNLQSGRADTPIVRAKYGRRKMRPGI